MASPDDERSRPAKPGRVGFGSARGSLCTLCAHVQEVTSARGSVFYLCTRSKLDARFPKYPPQPVVVCPGFERYAAPEKDVHA